MTMNSFGFATFIGFLALAFKLSIPYLLPYGKGVINLDRPSFSDVDPTIQTLHNGNLVKIYERISGESDQVPLLVGPETVVIDNESNIYVLAYDKVVKLTNLGKEETSADGSRIVLADVTLVAKVPGATLGGKFVPNTKILYFADAVNGLCRIDLSKPKPKVELIASSFQLEDGTWSKIAYADDLDIGPNTGYVYFSDASDIAPERNEQGKWDTMEAYKYDLMRGKKSGRLLQYDPATDKVTVLANDIWFANGIAVDENEEFVVISETSMMRILKYHLKGPKKGTLEVMIDNFPGIPDGADCTPTYCYAPFPSSVPPIINVLYKLPPAIEAWLRTFIMMLPKSFSPKPTHYGGIAQVTLGSGTLPSQMNALFQDPDGKYIHMITGVTENHGKLYLGSLTNNYVGVLDLGIPIN